MTAGHGVLRGLARRVALGRRFVLAARCPLAAARWRLAHMPSFVERGAIAVLLLLSAPGFVTRPSSLAAQEPGASLRISVLTFGQGNAVFERFGHNALRVQDTATGLDLAYNWGMFSFEQPNFLGRFLSGDTQYWVEAFPTPFLLQVYAEQDRQSVEQVLALTPAQRLEIATFVAANAREANKYYRYDYFRDNCSTRLRDALDRVLGGSLKRRFEPITTEWSYRNESVRLTREDGLAQAGIDVALGPRADIPITAWESMFIPMRLRDLLRDVTVPTRDGPAVPLVAEERVLYEAKRLPELPERRGLSIGAWGPVLGAWMFLLAPVGVIARRRTRIPAAIMVALFYGVTGLVGVVLIGMWVGSSHVFWYNNLNLLLFSPFALLAAVPAARAILIGKVGSRTKGLVLAVLGGAVLALLLSAVVNQRLMGPILLALPAHIGLAVLVWRHTRPRAAATP